MKFRVAFVLFASAISLAAAPINPNNILVSIGMVLGGDEIAPEHDFVGEYTPTGELCRLSRSITITVLMSGRGDHLRQIAVDPYGYIDAFNGTTVLFLTRYCSRHPVTSRISPHSLIGTSSITSPMVGIAAYQNFIYAGNWNGIIRFDTADHTAARFSPGTSFIELNIGLDRKLYALRELYPAEGGATEIFVFDPSSMELLKVHSNSIRYCRNGQHSRCCCGRIRQCLPGGSPPSACLQAGWQRCCVGAGSNGLRLHVQHQCR